MALQPDLATTNCSSSTIRLNQQADFSTFFFPSCRSSHARIFKHIATKGNLQQHAKNPTRAQHRPSSGGSMHQTTGGEFWPVWCVTHRQRVTKQHAHERRGEGGNDVQWHMRRKAVSISVWKVAAQRRGGKAVVVVVFKTGPFPPWDGRIKAENEIRLSSGDTAWLMWDRAPIDKNHGTSAVCRATARQLIVGVNNTSKATNTVTSVRPCVPRWVFFFFWSANRWLGESLSYVGQSSPGGGFLCPGVYTEVPFVLICL